MKTSGPRFLLGTHWIRSINDALCNATFDMDVLADVRQRAVYWTRGTGRCTKFKFCTTARFLLSYSGFRHRVFCQVNTKCFGRIICFHIQHRRRQKHLREFGDSARGYPIPHDSHHNTTEPKYFYYRYSFLRFGWKFMCVLRSSGSEEKIQLTQTGQLVSVPK
jgi:hypothetical protein